MVVKPHVLQKQITQQSLADIADLRRQVRVLTRDLERKERIVVALLRARIETEPGLLSAYLRRIARKSQRIPGKIYYKLVIQ